MLISRFVLNGVLDDISGYNNDLIASSTGAITTSSTIHKMDKSGYLNGTGYLYSSKAIIYKKVTFTSWIYILAGGTTSGIINNFSYAGSSGYNVGFYLTSSNNLAISIPNKNGNDSISYVSSAIIQLNSWNHVAASVDTITGDIKFYLNGDYIDFKTINSNNLPVNTIKKELLIGQWAWDNLYMYSYIGYLNDVRVYDNILTKKELREVYKTCIAHYNFNNPSSEPTANLLSSDIIALNTGFNLSEIIEDGESFYRVSLTKTEGIESIYHYIDFPSYTSTGGSYTIHIKIRILKVSNINIELKHSRWEDDCLLDFVSIEVVNDVKEKDKWIEYTLTRTIDSLYTIDNIDYIASPRIELCSNDLALNDIITSRSIIFDFKDVMIEKKDHATPFVRTSRIGQINDYSGMGNNIILSTAATKVAAPSWTKYSKFGSGCFKYNGLSNYIQNQTSRNMILEEYSLSCWISISEYKLSSIIRIFLSGPATIAWFGKFLITENDTIRFFPVFNDDINYLEYNINFELDEWVYLVGTYNKFIAKMYINGNKVSEKNINYIEIPAIVRYSNIMIGADYISGGIYNYLNGKVDNVSLYAVALSDEDILNSYKSIHTIDINNNFYCKEIIECENSIYNMSNLIYNGGLELKNNTNFPTELTYNINDGFGNGCLESYGNNSGLISNELIPINKDNIYELSFWARNIDPLYIIYSYFGFECYDNNKNIINIYEVQKYDNTDTTLALTLNTGDTTITLASSSGWNIDNINRKIGICDNIAWGYNRSTINTFYSSITGNILTLDTAWTGPTIQAGTKVANFYSNGDDKYNIFIDRQYLSNEWTKYIIRSDGAWNNCTNGFKYSTSYVKFVIGCDDINQDLNYGIRICNINLKNISSPQHLIVPSYTNSISFKSNGIIPYEINEVGMNIRYIRDYANGSNINNSTHWSQIEAHNDISNNMALGKSVSVDKVYTVNGDKSSIQLITDGDISPNNYINIDSSNGCCTVDLGYVQIIDIVKIWHYYTDNRIYHNTKTEVSQDGINWITIFDSTIEGEYCESDNGHNIVLYPDKMKLTKSNQIFARSFNEV